MTEEKRRGRRPKGERATTSGERMAAKRERERQQAEAEAARLAGLAARLRMLAEGNPQAAALVQIAGEIGGTEEAQPVTAQIGAEDVDEAGAALNLRARDLLARFAGILARSTEDQLDRVAGRLGALEAIIPPK